MTSMNHRRNRFVSLGKVSIPKPINLRSQKSENNGMDPNVNLVPKTAASTGSVWGHPPEAHAAPVVPPPVGVPRSMMASSGPAWGGAGLPDARKDISSVKGDEFPELAAGSAAGRDGSHGKLGSGQSHADEHGRPWEAPVQRNEPPPPQEAVVPPQHPRSQQRKEGEGSYWHPSEQKLEVGGGRAWADQQEPAPDVWIPPEAPHQGPPAGPGGPAVLQAGPGGAERWRPDGRGPPRDYGRPHDRYPQYGMRPQFEGPQQYHSGPAQFAHPPYRNHPGGPNQGQQPDFHVIHKRAPYSRDPHRDGPPLADDFVPPRGPPQQFRQEGHARDVARLESSHGAGAPVQDGAVPNSRGAPELMTNGPGRSAADTQSVPSTRPPGPQGNDVVPGGHFPQDRSASGDLGHTQYTVIRRNDVATWHPPGGPPDPNLRNAYRVGPMGPGVPQPIMPYQQQGHPYGPPPPGGGYVQHMPGPPGPRGPQVGMHMGGAPPRGYSAFPQAGLQQEQQLHVQPPPPGPQVLQGAGLPPPGPQVLVPMHHPQQGAPVMMQFGSYDPNNSPPSPGGADTGRSGGLRPLGAVGTQMGPGGQGPAQTVSQHPHAAHHQSHKPAESHISHQQRHHGSEQKREHEVHHPQAQPHVKSSKPSAPVLMAVPISTGGTVPHGTPMVAEIEAKQREEAKKARPARDASKAEKENVPRPSHRAPRSHAGQTQRQQVPGAADKGGAGTPEAAVSGSQTERQAVAAGGSQEGKQGVDGVKALKEQEAVMQSSVQRARERNQQAHKREVRDGNGRENQPKPYPKNGLPNGTVHAPLRNGELPHQAHGRPSHGERARGLPRDGAGDHTSQTKPHGGSAPASPRGDWKPAGDGRRGSEGYKRDKPPRAIPTQKERPAANGEPAEDGKPRARGPKSQHPKDRRERDRGPRAAPVPLENQSAGTELTAGSSAKDVPGKDAGSAPENGAPPLRNGEHHRAPQGQQGPRGPPPGPRQGSRSVGQRNLEPSGSADATLLASNAGESRDSELPAQTSLPPGIAPPPQEGTRAQRERRERQPKRLRERRERQDPAPEGSSAAPAPTTPPGLSGPLQPAAGEAAAGKPEAPRRQGGGRAKAGQPPRAPPGLLPDKPAADGTDQDRHDKAVKPQANLDHRNPTAQPERGNASGKQGGPVPAGSSANGPDHRGERKPRERKANASNGKSGPRAAGSPAGEPGIDRGGPRVQPDDSKGANTEGATPQPGDKPRRRSGKGQGGGSSFREKGGEDASGVKDPAQPNPQRKVGASKDSPRGFGQARDGPTRPPGREGQSGPAGEVSRPVGSVSAHQGGPRAPRGKASGDVKVPPQIAANA